MAPGQIRAATFDELPELGQGEIAKLSTGAPGVDLESVVAAVADAFNMGGFKPSDNPLFAVPPAPAAPALTTPQPGAPAPALAAVAPVQRPDTPPAAALPGGLPLSVPSAASVGLTEEQLAEKVRRVTEKFGGDPAATARAYVEAQRKITSLGQDNAAIMAAVAPVLDRQSRIETQLAQMMSMLQPGGGFRHPGAAAAPPADPSMPGATGTSASADEFMRDPEGRTREVVTQVVRQEMVSFTQAQSRAEAERRMNEDYFAVFNANKDVISILKPVMDELYVQHAQAYNQLAPADRLRMLIGQAQDRVEAWKGQQIFEQTREILGQNGGALTAPPGNSGAVPSGAAARGVPGAQVPRPGDLSNTPAMQRMWRAPSGSLEEEIAIASVLKERGHYAGLAPRY